MTATVVAGAALLLLAGCATPGPSSPGVPGMPVDQPWPQPAAPTGTVMAQGTVMDVAGRVELCLGAVAESYPPQCRGPELHGWSWDGVDGGETSGEVTWGAYAMEGRFDGDTFTLTGEPLMLALYDPMSFRDPTDGKPGVGEPAELERIQEALPDRLGDDGRVLLGSYPENGWLWVDVVWDDGTIQHAADAEFGGDVVVVRSALRQH